MFGCVRLRRGGDEDLNQNVREREKVSKNKWEVERGLDREEARKSERKSVRQSEGTSKNSKRKSNVLLEEGVLDVVRLMHSYDVPHSYR